MNLGSNVNFREFKTTYVYLFDFDRIQMLIGNTLKKIIYIIGHLKKKSFIIKISTWRSYKFKKIQFF